MSLSSVACLAGITTCVVGMNQHRIALNSGSMMPYVNLGGTSQAVKPGNHYSNYSEYLRQGGRGIDTALTYTDAVNEQIAAAIKAHPEIERSDIFVTSKVPCCPRDCKSPEFNGTIANDVKRNAQLLELDYVDLTLLHWPCPTDEQTIDKYVELQDAMSLGLTKAIGVSNFNSVLLAKLLADPRVKTVPAVNQCNHAIGNHNESHKASIGGDDLTVKYCFDHDISYSAYSPLEGLSGQNVFDLPQVIAVAKTHNVSGAQVALKWLVQQNITVVTAAHNPEYIAEDIDLWSFNLTEQEITELAAI